MPSPARSTAFQILLRVATQDAYAGELLHSARLERLSPTDRSLCTELVMGVLRWQSRLDSEIAKRSQKTIARLDPEVRIALWLGAYQLTFLSAVPPHAAVNESVELVKAARKRSAAPFVNAVLRKIAAGAREEASATADTSAPSLAERYAHPAWIVERWIARYGSTKTELICRYDQQVPPTALRMVDPSAEAELAKSGVEVEPGRLLRTARRLRAGDLVHIAAFREGRVAIQDEASQLVALLVGRGQRILDCCAAPGGKTAIIAKQNPEAAIVATDLHPKRARAMRALLEREKIHVISADATRLPLVGGFDRALADVPCSGTGTLARNPEIKWRLKLNDLADLYERQVAILTSALGQLAPGGRLVYSTCSLEPEECEDVVATVLKRESGYKLLPCGEELERLKAGGELAVDDLPALLDGPYLRTLPGVHPCDGFFAATIVRA